MGVPLFFMVNGGILLNRNYVLKNHVIKIAIFFILLIIWASITLLLESPKYGDHYSIKEFITVIYKLKERRIAHLWFLKALIYVYLLFPIIKALFDKNDKELLIYLLAISLLFCFGSTFLNTLVIILGYLYKGHSMMIQTHSYFVWINPFSADYPFTLTYFIIGGLLAKYIDKIHLKRRLLVIIIILALLLLFFYGIIKFRTTGIYFDTVWSGYDSIMILISSIAAFIICAKTTINNNRIKKCISLIGSNTLGIYFIHCIISVWISQYFLLFMKNFLFFNILYTLLVLIISLFITLIIRRIPFVKRLVEV